MGRFSCFILVKGLVGVLTGSNRMRGIEECSEKNSLSLRDTKRGQRVLATRPGRGRKNVTKGGGGGHPSGYDGGLPFPSP